MLAALDQGLIYALLAFGVFLTYRILNFADLTVDGSFTTGAGTAAILITNGVNPFVATFCGFVAGALAGLITALLHTKLGIDPLLASILNMIALYSINLRIMGKANLPLIKASTIFTPIKESSGIASVTSILILLAFAFVIKLLIDWFLSTNFGISVMSTGDNIKMAESFGVSSDFVKIVTLMLSNGLVGLSGAILAQYQGFADIGMGIGLILVGLASVIVGNAILGTRYMFLASLGALLGSVVYRLVIFYALKWDFFSAQDMKLISAVLVVFALVVSQSKTVRDTFTKINPFKSSKERPDNLTDIPGRQEVN